MNIQLDPHCMVSVSEKMHGNMAYHVPLDTADVLQNRKNFITLNGQNYDNTVFMEQVHGNSVIRAQKGKVFECDGLITEDKNLTLAVMVADCVPVVIFDTKKHILCALHAGRTGTFNNIVKNAIDLFLREYGSNPNDLVVYMGPSIHPCCYEVSKEIASIVSKSYGDKFVVNRHIDLQGINKKMLIECGVQEKHINIDPHCTACNNERFYSYRKEQAQSGRFVCTAKII
jgi:hypothetical protein